MSYTLLRAVLLYVSSIKTIKVTWFPPFLKVYSPDMPSRLPIQDIFAGLVTSIGTAIRYWFHYTLVAFAWLGVVPLTACKYVIQYT